MFGVAPYLSNFNRYTKNKLSVRCKGKVTPNKPPLKKRDPIGSKTKFLGIAPTRAKIYSFNVVE